ncbi:MAG: sodium-dependent transporter, partial [Synergistaceae bacterium]|nr:sodium-dependent transporter [Synergistaceae bacterium]
MGERNEGGLQREQWGSRVGFILAAAGSAVGLGNIWRFPYLVGKNGGAAFVLIYLIIAVFIGFPVMLAEFAVGRGAQRSPILAFRALKANPFWSLIGWMGVVAGGFLTLSFYNIVGGWTIKYVVASLTGLMDSAAAGRSAAVFDDFTGQPNQVIFFQVVFMALTMMIVLGGVGKGIERACKIMTPALFVILLILILRSVTLPGAGAGIDFYLKPDLEKLTASAILDALGQNFFSFSLGLGIMITYGSYSDKSERLPSAAIWTGSLDTAIAFLAGFAIFPAVFAMGFEPGAGVGLTFITLPAVFAKMPAGMLFSFLFFVLLFFAALTSSMSLLEVAVAFGMEKFRMERSKAVWTLGIIIILLGLPSAASFSGYPAIGGKPFFEAVEYLCNNILLPVGSLLLSIFVGWFWLQPGCREITNGDEDKIPVPT